MDGDNKTKSLVEALYDKYEEQDITDAFSCITITRKPRTTSESGDLILPKLLSVEKYDISACGDLCKLSAICGHVTELSLMCNGIREWKEVAAMLQCMPCLTSLNLADNPLAHSQSALTSSELERNQITRLVLNGTGVQWGALAGVLRVFNRLQELHLSKNNYSFVDISGFESHPCLEQLYMNKTSLVDWAAVSSLGRVFPRLKQLVMIGSQIEVIDYNNEFENITEMNLSQSKLRDWSELEKLRRFPNLTSVRLSAGGRLPFLQHYPCELSRELTVAYLPNVTMLNGSPVTEEERRGAERAFIRHYSHQQAQPQRYFELLEKFGSLDPQDNDEDPCASGNIRIKAQYENITQDVVLHDITLYWMHVAEMQRIISHSFGKDVKTLRFFHVPQNNWMCTEELKIPNKYLDSIPIEDGDTILVDKKL